MVTDTVPPPMVKPTGRPVMGTLKRFTPPTKQEIADWIYKTPIDVLAEHAANGIDLDNPPRDLVFPRPPPPGAQGTTIMANGRTVDEERARLLGLPPLPPENREVPE